MLLLPIWMKHFTTADYFHYCLYFVGFGVLLYSNLLLTKIFGYFCPFLNIGTTMLRIFARIPLLRLKLLLCTQMNTISQIYRVAMHSLVIKN